MNNTEHLNTLNRLDALIRRKGTGSPEQLADKFNVSVRTIYNHIKILKSIGGPIYYCKSRRSYCYERSARLFFGYVFDDVGVVKGGQSKHFDIFYHTAKYFAGRRFRFEELI